MARNIGKGKNMSISRAALKVFFEEIAPTEKEQEREYISSGDLNIIHRIVDVAGAEHASIHTLHQVLSRLSSSPYWHATHSTKGWNGGTANCWIPTEKGRRYYEQRIKLMKTDV